MNTQQNIDQSDDLFLFELMEELPVDKAPAGFTSGIMQQVYSGVEPVTESPEYRRQMIWAYLSIGAAIIIFFIMMFAQWPFLKINLPTDQGQLLNVLHTLLGVFEGFGRLMTYLKGSSTMLIIFFSLTLLLIIERFFRRGISQKSSFLF
ncbi:MAG: hypothetical protein IPN08_01795 [Bacteroidales bacterium]|nr:hypothetical protein [Bacteroidales bacterium]MBK9356118.1 hypothetical protein [Bacteroidales bacterium]